MRAVVPAVVAALVAIWIATLQGIPYLVVLVAVCALVAEFVMRRTRFGAQLYAIGGNPEAARLSGINLSRVNLLELRHRRDRLRHHRRRVNLPGQRRHRRHRRPLSRARCDRRRDIGGTSLSGGRGRVLGALLGALLMGSLNNGMSLMNVPTFYQDTARGVVLLLAVAIDQLSRRRAMVVR